ncbi:DUF6230 family protein [Allokutzneria sp. NRRL B-24872]|uniref:DUF6230 family protein n=1 Tax=Allokutzneria sp. NRRL B-24872 TaxID=1137961 RepID=UPI000A39A0A6|nr:DUF6230 family protein [Allokutzneria sp. NRRL B-24872]
MTEDAPARRAGGTRWSRFAVIVTVSLALAGGLVYATASAALPTSFALSGTNFKFSAKRVEGKGFAQFVGLGAAARSPMAVTGMASALVSGLCFSALVPTPLGAVTIRAEAGGDKPVEARDLVLNLSEMRAEATATNLTLGVDAARLDGATGITGRAGDYAHQAEKIVISDLKANASTTTAGTFRMTGLSITVKAGRQECF